MIVRHEGPTVHFVKNAHSLYALDVGHASSPLPVGENLAEPYEMTVSFLSSLS